MVSACLGDAYKYALSVSYASGSLVGFLQDRQVNAGFLVENLKLVY